MTRKSFFDKNQLPCNECQYADLIPLAKDELKQPLLMCTENVQFQFNNILYRRVYRVIMESPLGLISRDLFMLNLEQTVVKSTDNETTLYVTYVYDTFFVRNDSQHPSRILELFNRENLNIRFPMEAEHDNMFHFLRS